MTVAIPTLNIGEILAGTEFTAVVTVTSDDVAVDIGAWSIKLHIDFATAVTLAVGSGITILDDGDNGQFRITIAAALTEGFVSQKVPHECQYNTGAGDDKALFRGSSTIYAALIAEI